MNKLIELIKKSVFEDGKLYLIDKPNDNFGFFYQDQIIYFGKKSDESSNDICSIDTLYLDLNANVYISNVTENSSFEAGYYDLLSFKGNIDDPNEEPYFDAFYNICLAFANNPNMPFVEFFSSLVEIFKKSKEGVFKNIVGLIGELVLIKSVYLKKNIDISNNWHLTGINSKFDFCFSNFNVEVKTTTKSEQKFLLKHNQLFNNQNNYVCVISLIETGEGESVKSLYNYFSNETKFSNNVKFQIALTKELMRVSDRKELNRSFAVDYIELYSVADMEEITYIPSCISNLSYEYDFSDTPKYQIEDIICEQ